MTPSDISRAHLLDAIFGACRVMARGDTKTRDDVAPALLLLMEIESCLQSDCSDARDAPRYSTEFHARRFASLERALQGFDPPRQMEIIQQRTGRSRASVYRDRQKARHLKRMATTE